MNIHLAIGIFACCGKPHLIGAAMGDKRKFTEGVKQMLPDAERGMGKCKQLLEVEIPQDQFEELISTYHAKKYPGLVEVLRGAFTETMTDIQNGEADKSPEAAANVTSILDRFKVQP